MSDTGTGWLVEVTEWVTPDRSFAMGTCAVICVYHVGATKECRNWGNVNEALIIVLQSTEQ